MRYIDVLLKQNLFSRNSPYSLNCHVGAILVFRMLCRITQSSDTQRTESVLVMDHHQTMGVNSRVLDEKQQNICGRISLFWSVELTYLLHYYLRGPWSPSFIAAGHHHHLVKLYCSATEAHMLEQFAESHASGMARNEPATYRLRARCPIHYIATHHHK